MKINQVTNQLGISRKAILYYENEGLIEPTRDTNNYRVFSQEQVRTLKLIYKLRLAKVPVAVIKSYITGGDINVLENYLVTEQKQLEMQLQALEQLQLEKLDAEYIRPRMAINYIKENIEGAFGIYICDHYNYYLQKDNVTYQGNEEVFKQIIEYIDSNDFTAVNHALVKYPEVELPTEIHDISYKQVSNMRMIELAAAELVQQVEQIVNPIQAELEKINFYTEFIPLIRKLSPSFNLYSEKLEWLEAKRLEVSDD